MQLFYSSKLTTVGQTFDIVDQENQHLVKVLRNTVGDKIFVTNGQGSLFQAVLVSVGKRKSSLEVTDLVKQEDNKHNLSIAIAPTKNISRLEWFIEKSVEIGISNIYLFVSQNSERRAVKLERLKSKALSAMKQSLKYTLPEVHDLIKFPKILEHYADNFDAKFIAYCEENDNKFSNKIKSNKQTLILIGPEGGFSKEEVGLSKHFGCVAVSLGSSRLRTETAGIYACSVFNSLYNPK